MATLFPGSGYLVKYPHPRLDRRRPPRYRLERGLRRTWLSGATGPELPRQPFIPGCCGRRTRVRDPLRGTGSPGGLTELGVQLLKAMRRKRVILDLSHMADQSVADAFALWRGPIMASHSNARALVPGDRQITDATAKEVARRDGILGISFYA